MSKINFTKALDLLSDTEKRMKDIDVAQRKLRNALAAISEIDNGAKACLVLKCDGGASDMYIGNLFDEKSLTAYVKDRLEMVARENFEILLSFKPVQRDTSEDEIPEVKIPEELAKKKEQREDPEPKTPEPATVAKMIGKNGKAVVNDTLLDRMYFKEGKSAKNIARETGLSESAVFNHIAKIRAAKEKAAKECVRH